MDSKELWKLFELDYFDLLLELKKKYGIAEGSYFLNETCRSINKKISRAKEGLYLHHDKEWNPDKIECHSLSTKDQALQYPYEYQHGTQLTYCNMLEHLMIHIKINQLRREACGYDFIDGVERFIIPQLNDMYNTRVYRQEHLVNTKKLIEHNYSDYLLLLDEYSKISGIPRDYLLTLTNRQK